MTRLPETALHRIWERHDLLTPPLRTSDGRAVRIMHAGVPNPDSGPDFLGAVIRIGATTFRGDVEIHTTPAGWHLHHHHTDPRYNRVILHVVGGSTAGTTEAHTASGRPLPLLVLPLPHVMPPAHPASHDRIVAACVARLRRSRNPRRTLARYGWHRIHTRMSRLEHRLHQLIGEGHGIIAEPEASSQQWLHLTPAPGRSCGKRDLLAAHHWEQLVYEAVMEAMGYARNSAAFVLLARTVTLNRLRQMDMRDRDMLMGILFGAAGLLSDPASAVDDEAAAYIRTLHRCWRSWTTSGTMAWVPEMAWVFFRLRPANFPTARIAAMAHLLPVLFAPGRLCILLHDVADARTPMSIRIHQIRQALTIAPEGYWAHHLHFHDHWKERGVRLGKDRIAVILLNALLPIALLHTTITQNAGRSRRLHALAHDLPRPQGPEIIREIREEALGRNVKLTAVEGQGLLEMVKQMKSEEGREKREKRRTAGPKLSSLFSLLS